MKTVKEIVENDRVLKSINSTTKHRIYESVIEFAQAFEDAHFIVQQIFYSGTVKIKIPDWYKLNPDAQILMRDLIFACAKFNENRPLKNIRIGRYAIFVKRG